MIQRNATPTSHVPPRGRIDYSPVRIAPAAAPESEQDATMRIIENARIWALVRQSAEGVNQVGATDEPV